MAVVFLMGREAFQKLSNPEPNKSDIPIILEVRSLTAAP